MVNDAFWGQFCLQLTADDFVDERVRELNSTLTRFLKEISQQ